jgi:hypothetical protein
VTALFLLTQTKNKNCYPPENTKRVTALFLSLTKNKNCHPAEKIKRDRFVFFNPNQKLACHQKHKTPDRFVPFLNQNPKLSSRPKQADAFSFQLRSCEVVGLRSGGTSLRSLAEPLPSLPTTGFDFSSFNSSHPDQTSVPSTSLTHNALPTTS